MKKLLETMYILTPESYLCHRNETICISVGGQEKASVPAKDVDSIDSGDAFCKGFARGSGPVSSLCLEVNGDDAGHHL